MRDFLLDISSVATCFEGYGHHPLSYIVNMLKPRVNTYHTLLGNFAGSALDDIVNNEEYNINDTFRSNFKEKALEYATCVDFDAQRFKKDAERQVANMKEIVYDLMSRSNLSPLTPHSSPQYLLEPSFICPKLGLQGRVDLMTNDFRLLVEQKSGKNICPQKHYVQALLYYAVLAENFGLSADDVDIELLYSKFPLPDGLRHIDAERNKRLLEQALEFRDEVVALFYKIAKEGFGCVMDQLTPETLAANADNDTFFQRYELPRLQALLQPLHDLTPLERAYFERMMTFVVKEQITNKVGSPTTTQFRSTADLWRMPLEEKREMGNIYTGLTILEKSQSSSYNGYDTIVLNVPDQGEDFMPDFRRGDLVYLYAYTEQEGPDITKAILYKGVLAEIMPDRVTVHLNDGQQDGDVFSLDSSPLTPKKYAIEHGSSDITGGAAMHSLYAFVTAPQSCKDLLLGQRSPRKNTSIQLSRSYHPDYDDVLLRVMQAEDYFLLVGPPGTGKTSMALRFIVEEMMAHRGKDGDGEQGNANAILLMSYTNRAVDEICSMLEDDGQDFIRLGNEYSCEPRFRKYLLSSLDSKPMTLSGLRRRLEEVPIVVSTTSTMMARPFLLNVKRFAMTIVDEASQILEPNIIGLLAETDCRFVLIGDYKQLPAVVQQDEKDSAVDNQLLRDIRFDNCRNSLFERLIQTEKAACRTDFIGVLHKHGRMHPAIAAFPCLQFYTDEQLEPVPLPHQREENDDKLFMGKRVIFLPSDSCEEPRKDDEQTGLSDKVNVEEAKTVARMLIGIREYYGADFDVNKSVGVIVPYRNQIAMIRKCLVEQGAPELQAVTIDTVERYQGSQRDIIIYSFTVHKQYQLDFLTSNTFVEDGRLIDRKLNVAMTRARKQLIMTGNEQILSLNPLFKDLIRFVREQ